MSPFWTNVSIIASICGIIGFLVWLANRQLAFTKWLENRRRLRKKKHTQEQSVYLNGLIKLLPRQKTLILNEALRAREKYKHEEAITNFKILLSQATDDSERCALLNLIGLSQFDKGDRRDAEKTFLEMIRIAEKAKNDEALTDAFGNIGLVYQTLSELGKALEHHQKAMEMAEKIGSLKIQARILGNIGLIYDALGEPRKALNFHQRALFIAYKIKNSHLEADNLNNLGNAWRALGDSNRALEHYQHALKVDERISNREGQANQLNNIGVVYFKWEKYKDALGYFQRAREIFAKIGAKHEVEKTDRNIALAKKAMGEGA